jgi:site-specific DNA-cytosine methylase
VEGPAVSGGVFDYVHRHRAMNWLRDMLTPTECERLQGFPDQWTIPNPTAGATARAGTPSPSMSSNGSGEESSITRGADEDLQIR